MVPASLGRTERDQSSAEKPTLSDKSMATNESDEQLSRMSFAKDLVKHEQLERLIERATQNYKRRLRRIGVILALLSVAVLAALGSAFYNGVLSDRPDDARAYLVAVVPVGLLVAHLCVLSTDRKSVLVVGSVTFVTNGLGVPYHSTLFIRSLACEDWLLRCALPTRAIDTITALFAFVALGWSLFRCCQKKLHHRVLLDRLFKIFTLAFTGFGIARLLQGVLPGIAGAAEAVVPWSVCTVIFFACAIITGVPAARRRASIWISHAGGEPDSVVHLLGGSGKQARQRLKLAKEHLRVVPFSALREDDFLTSVAAADLKTRTESSTKEPDAFISHSWSDDGVEKYRCLASWAKHFTDGAGAGNSPVLWLDKACIDQEQISIGLKCLPFWLLMSNRFVIVLGPTYSTRLWCLLELFAFSHVGKPDAIETLDWSEGGNTDISVKNAQCSVVTDYHNLMSIIENSFKTISGFQQLVERIVKKQRRAPLLRHVSRAQLQWKQLAEQHASLVA